ncbi:endonuclease/exonuclease/phosphatase family protein [Streptomyces sp. PKU-EA00015]|uniref:endonuclease/exonuclease/phosphatase family protein n=1 Tax=Streptomyces sp. PKU-EA00015 TaxID=2748326 RepID=UPI0015A27562|nr:endonuclease/exonuclease/phosphatase family protein [Streptomyces sp. PKU-EA00015]NWF28996.1 endonuclease/exonuclease/phosphatase family protein [Streptomyces sp. PKU-EA00015]
MTEPGSAARSRRRIRLPRRGRVVAACAVVTAFLLTFHRAVPNTPGRIGSLLETFLPWLGLAVPVLLVAAALRRSVTALVALLLPTAAWLGHFGPLLLPAGDEPHDIVAVQHNVSDVNADPAGTARALLRERPDIVALEEVTPEALPVYAESLAARCPHRAVVGTVGLWSAHPIRDVRPVDIRPHGIGPDWNRGMRATVRTPEGDVAVYVAHLPSVRLGVHGLGSARRDESAALLAEAIAAEEVDRVILLGDLNATVDDRGLDPLGSRLRVAGPGMAFSWPAAFPVARIDQVMARSATVVDVRSLPATGSDHLPLVARIRL